ncbi:pyridoxal phosphate-dependent aminotransferase [Leucobacter chinensis]|uniref:pyridoxal phosphate-dependent aminotransferase n=1 Tax=Leucobacter chinensis TaxID=2851010 RepID=UPI001C230669|nr:histidinol-phosphate transaminase [Leucobacter chinensis]
MTSNSPTLPTPRPWLSALNPYIPGEPALDPLGSLASNENPLGPSPQVVSALEEPLADLARYPDALSNELVSEIAKKYGVSEQSVLVGNGSDELIQLLVTAYAAFGGRVVCADPPYQLHEKLPAMLGASVTKVPLTNFTHDLSTMATVDAELAFVCNPHNPTGTLLEAEAITHFARASSSRLTVVDEAYIEYAQPAGAADPSLIRQAAAGELAVLRTFSKFYGLAGLRIGFLVAAPEIISTLTAIRLPFGVNRIAQTAASIALTDSSHGNTVRETNAHVRDRLTSLFKNAGYEVIPSHTNFVLVVTSEEPALVRRLADEGVRVRPGSSLGLPGTVRVSVPNEAGLAKLEAISWLTAL